MPIFYVFLGFLGVLAVFKLHLAMKLDWFFDALKDNPTLHQAAGSPDDVYFLFRLPNKKTQLYRFFCQYPECPPDLNFAPHDYRYLRTVFMLDFWVERILLFVILLVLFLCEVYGDFQAA